MKYDALLFIVSFITIFLHVGCDRSDPVSPDDTTVTDIDGNVYTIVQIGDQWWMAENLRTTRYRNGDAISTGLSNIDWQTTTSGAYAIYPHANVDGINSEEEMVNAYGKLYNWYAVDDDYGLCPEGWHLPGDDDLQHLAIYLGLSQEEADSSGLLGAGEGGKMKSTRTEPESHPRWNSPNPGATNESGWSGLPAGARMFHGNFDFIGLAGYWWSSTEYPEDSAWYHSVYSSYDQIGRYYHFKHNGFSVRCLRND